MLFGWQLKDETEMRIPFEAQLVSEREWRDTDGRRTALASPFTVPVFFAPALESFVSTCPFEPLPVESAPASPHDSAD